MSRSEAMREDAMRKVQMYSFALVDTGLFLDTHPQNKAALMFYEQVRDEYAKAAADYEERFGPLTARNTDVSESWKWVCEPWPWEMED